MKRVFLIILILMVILFLKRKESIDLDEYYDED